MIYPNDLITDCGLMLDRLERIDPKEPWRVVGASFDGKYATVKAWLEKLANEAAEVDGTDAPHSRAQYPTPT